MKEAFVTVSNDTGLHSRPADLFVRTAKLYESSIQIFNGDKSANAKNIIRVIALNVSQGKEIRIEADGSDEDKALEDLVQLVKSDFKTPNPAVTI